VARAAKGRGSDAEAHRLYLLARHMLDRFTREDTSKGIAYLKEALERDPEFALAWAELSRAYFIEAGLGLAPVAEGLGRAREAAERSLALDPDLAEAHVRLGWAHLHRDLDVRAAEASIARALELAPQRSATRNTLAFVQLARGQGEEALAEALREQDEGYRLWTLAIAHHGQGHAEESDAALREVIGKYADSMACQVAEAYGARGEVERALDWLERAYAQRDPGLVELKCNPRFRSLHGDPRWGAFLRKMGLGDSWPALPGHSGCCVRWKSRLRAKPLRTALVPKPSRGLPKRGLRRSPARSGHEWTYFDTVLAATVVANRAPPSTSCKSNRGRFQDNRKEPHAAGTQFSTHRVDAPEIFARATLPARDRDRESISNRRARGAGWDG